ncbi:hypothetical protein [Clavibacter phaseoli]|nr:hypothetical protein [Clavibacter phaseoli]
MTARASGPGEDGPASEAVDADPFVADPSRVGWVVSTWTHDDSPASG